MVSRVGVSEDFRKQVLGYGLTTAEILYRMPDHPSLLQTYVWELRSVSEIPGAEGLFGVLAGEAGRAAVLGDGGAFQADQAR